jgi:hypothetical protein
MTVSRGMATAFVEGYGRTWGSWDFDGFVDLFKDDVVYVEHPVNETVVGREAMGRYIRREQAEAGTVRVRMGSRSSTGIGSQCPTVMESRRQRSPDASSHGWTRRTDDAPTFASTFPNLRDTPAPSRVGASEHLIGIRFQCPL